ncbi:HAD family hydrolase [Caldivirga maquilingensis]|uniref:HAD-superfamily hydrolase, subfamily IA, variant 1 n=1 Tax=Caldivirga maquilingensis (strain ATCC 700844 / DSM 13496 / JCM 10307 / IC-167) TaxID=397948 RepID=A8MDT6_CALMQ|nr:HAD family phosphatase [Caldivirga maquilingensis]ABW01942.1 HAD-superfamily hydrolase, subfamily IA, variant 1 [Caldivirga maquilingensis IC-167]
MLKGVVLDLDGTLADTAVIHGEAWRMAMRDLGIQARISVEQLLGKRAPEIALELVEGNTELAQRLLEKKNIYFKSLVGLAKPKACAVELLKSLRNAGIKLSVVTSSNRVSAYSVLEAVNMINLVDYIITGDDVNKGKPDPEPVIKALRLMNNEPREVMGVGDTIHDYEAYLRAGLKAIVIVINPLMVNHIAQFKDAIIIDNLCVLLNALDVIMKHNAE